MFHLELRQFPHQTREFNWTREQLEARVVGPWVRGESIELAERTWAPDRAKLVIYEGRALESDEIGMGRGWSNVTRSGEEVTSRVLTEARAAAQSPPALEALKRELLARSAQGPVGIAQVLELAGELEPRLPPPQRLELAGRAIWDLLQNDRLRLARPPLRTARPPGQRSAVHGRRRWRTGTGASAAAPPGHGHRPRAGAPAAAAHPRARPPVA